MNASRIKIVGNCIRSYSQRRIGQDRSCQEVTKERRRTAVPKCTKSPKLTPEEREKIEIEEAVLAKFQRKSVKVCVIGGHTKLGEMTALMLKQNPVVSRIFLAGENKRVLGIAADLNHIDTRSVVSGHFNDLPGAIRGADIILLLGNEDVCLDASVEEKLQLQGEKLVERATACSYFAPRSLLIVSVDPLSVTVPLVRSVYQAGNWYHPGKVIGSVALSQMRANTLVAQFQGLDPLSVDVPLIGGPDVDTIVPLFTRARPVGIPLEDALLMLKKFRGLPFDADLGDCKQLPSKVSQEPLSEAFAINRMITNVGLGLCGDSNSCFNAFVRTNLVQCCSHMTSTVRFGRQGLVHNYGVPKMYKTEFCLMLRSLRAMENRELLAQEYFLQYVEHQEEMLQQNRHASAQ